MKAVLPAAMRLAVGAGCRWLSQPRGLAAEWQMPHAVQDGAWSLWQEALDALEGPEEGPGLQWLAGLAAACDVCPVSAVGAMAVDAGCA